MYRNIKFIPYSYEIGSSLEDRIKEYGKNICCIYTESCSNPRGFMPDWDKIKNYKVIVDNTWLTGKIFNPLKHGAFAVVESCSKYLSNGGCIGGAMCTNDYVLWDNIFLKIRTYGIHISDEYCQKIYNGLYNLDKNLELITIKTNKLIDLFNNAKVGIFHPTLEGHKTINNYKKYVKSKSIPGVLLFFLPYKNIPKITKKWKEPLLELIRKCGILTSTSFGKKYTLIDSWPFKKDGFIWFRLSVGTDDEDIWEKLVILFEEFKKFDKTFG